MALEEYRRKRSFNVTPEPPPVVAKTKKRNLSFVIQKHDATRLHYDFRLELDGVLKSWAVPKGPSLDPQDKRLAVEVEDHPLEYGKFEGRIPEGEYGAGEVIVWDRGKWTPEKDPHEGLRKGKLEFHLDGEKLKGGWVLFRIRGREGDRGGKNNWLLVKRNDEFVRPASEYDITEALPRSVKSGRAIGDPAKRTRIWSSNRKSTTGKQSSLKRAVAAKRKGAGRAKRPARKAKKSLSPEGLSGARRAPFPKSLTPQLATLSAEAPRGAGWLHEIKFDGYRLLCRVQNGKAKLITRREQDWTHRYSDVAREAAELPVESALLDGELVALLPSGLSSFQALQNAGGNGAAANLVYYAFDLLYLDGYDLTRVPLVARKELLRQLLDQASTRRIQLSEHFTEDGPLFFKQSCRLGLEGIISKRADRPYMPGRSGEWLKTKCLGREELVIGGFTLSTALPRGIGALLVGYFDRKQLTYAGRVGTGFTTATLLELRERLERIKQEECPFAAVPPKERRKDVRWVRPELVAEIEFTAWTDAGVLRHPSFQGLREDKTAASVGRPASLRIAQNEVQDDQPMAKKRSAKSSQRKTSKPSYSLPASTSVKLTNLDRVLYPDIGLTKLGLATYYAQVAGWILPHVIGRPLSLVRCPEGQGGQCFFQKHPGKGTPEALERIKIREKDGIEDYVMIQNLDGLLSIVQMSVLEIHLWGSRGDRLEQPDRLIFDLDPDENLPWPRVIEGARLVRERLRKLDLESFVKTTGGKGLHVVVPISPRRQEWPAVKEFTRQIAESIVADQPKLYTANMSKAGRKGKIFIDYLRNDRGATAIAPYSTRRKPGAPVSVPLAWDELTSAIKSDHFNTSNLAGRLEGLASDPWAEIDKIKQSLPRRVQ